MTHLFSILISLVIVLYIAYCVYTAIIYLKWPERELPKKGTKSYYTFMHGKYVCYGADIVVAAALAIILVLWLAKYIELGL